MQISINLTQMYREEKDGGGGRGRSRISCTLHHKTRARTDTGTHWRERAHTCMSVQQHEGMSAHLLEASRGGRMCRYATPEFSCPTTIVFSIRQHTSAYVSIRQHTSAYVSIHQHTSACACIRQHTHINCTCLSDHDNLFVFFPFSFSLFSESSMGKVSKKGAGLVVAPARRISVSICTFVPVKQIK
jgi:hypothetical protein